MFDINEGEKLSEVTKFELNREDGRLLIDVYTCISEKTSVKYIAAPNLLTNMSDEQYWGAGNSKNEALNDCLTKIKKLAINTIVPHGKTVKK